MRILAVWLLLLLGISAAQAEVRLFKAVSSPKNLVQFTSKATMETVVGKTSKVDGHVALDADSVAGTTDAAFAVDLNSIDTGIGMRNNDMRKDFLETAKYPEATFKLTRFVSVDKPSLSPGETVHAVAEGDFTVHGVAKSYQIPVTLALAGPDRLNVTADWMVKLADHKISRPQMLFMRLSEEQNVHIDITMTSAAQ